MGFLRQEYWSGLPFPPSAALSDPGIEPISPALAARFFITEPPGRASQWAWSLDQEDPLEEEKASYSSILAWKIPWAEEPGGLRNMGHRVRHSWAHRHTEPSGSDSGMYISIYLPIYIIFQIIFPYRSLQNIKYSPLCSIVGWVVLVGYLFYIY